MQISKGAKDHTGERFGKLVVLKVSHRDKWGHLYWLCLCDCGNDAAVGGPELRNKKNGRKTRSCGCSTGEFLSASLTKHGQARHDGSKTGLYQSWADAKSRCSNSNVKAYHRYGGRGIKVCARWESFEAFKEDMGPIWKQGLTLDRIDPDGDYEPGNCQWLTREENSRKGRKHIPR